MKNAIKEWLTEFSIPKEAFGPISKPQPPVTSTNLTFSVLFSKLNIYVLITVVMPILPIIPSVNTCMSLTTTTTTSCTIAGNSKPSPAVPEFNTLQLQAFADVCSTVNTSTTMSNSVMNSLVSATKIVLNDNIPNTIASIATTNIEIPKKIPISTIPVPVMKIGSTHFIQDENNESNSLEMTEDIKGKDPQFMNEEDEELSELKIENEKKDLKLIEIAKGREENEIIDDENLEEPMECGSSVASQTSPNNMVKTLSEDVIMSDTLKNEVISIYICIYEFHYYFCFRL